MHLHITLLTQVGDVGALVISLTSAYPVSSVIMNKRNIRANEP